MKGHLSIGTRTHIVLDARVTGENGADAPEFLSLLKGAQASGIHFAEGVADKAYLSRDTLEGAAELGLDPFIPFKSNSTPKRGGVGSGGRSISSSSCTGRSSTSTITTAAM